MCPSGRLWLMRLLIGTFSSATNMCWYVSESWQQSSAYAFTPPMVKCENGDKHSTRCLSWAWHICYSVDVHRRSKTWRSSFCHRSSLERAKTLMSTEKYFRGKRSLRQSFSRTCRNELGSREESSCDAIKRKIFSITIYEVEKEENSG